MITMRDIAVRAGVSRSTVSFVLNKKHSAVGISEDTRRRVLRTAEEMGYRRNQLARAVVTGKNPVFAFVVPAPEVEVAARLLAGALEEAEARAHTVQVVRLPGSKDDHAVIERCVELRPVGIMAIYVQEPALGHLQREMARCRIPVAVLDSSFPQSHGARILSDDLGGCREAIGHLIALGHRRIAFLGGGPGSGASQQREEGYRRVLAERGIPVPEGYVCHGYWVPERIEAATRELFVDTTGSSAPTALFCADDKTAMVVCRTLRSIGRRVPEDVSVVGFADLTMALFNDPPLTTVAQPFHDMGRAAVTRLLSAAAEMKEEAVLRAPREDLLPTRLVVRASTAPVPPGDRA